MSKFALRPPGRWFARAHDLALERPRSWHLPPKPWRTVRTN